MDGTHVSTARDARNRLVDLLHICCQKPRSCWTGHRPPSVSPRVESRSRKKNRKTTPCTVSRGVSILRFRQACGRGIRAARPVNNRKKTGGTRSRGTIRSFEPPRSGIGSTRPVNIRKITGARPLRAAGSALPPAGHLSPATVCCLLDHESALGKIQALQHAATVRIRKASGFLIPRGCWPEQATRQSKPGHAARI